MPFCTPSIRGPVSEWSADLLVEDCIPGAVISIQAIGPSPRALVESVAHGGRDRVGLLPGERLRSGDRLLAMQRLGDEHSLWTVEDLGVPVGPAPADSLALAPVAFVSHVWECGSRLWVGGAVPGAHVTVSGPGGPLGSGVAAEGDARIALAANLPSPGLVVTAAQGPPPGVPPIKGVAKSTSALVQHLPLLVERRLPSPRLGGDAPRGCDPAAHFAGVFDGADVTVTRASGGPPETHIWDRDDLWFVFASPLAGPGDTLSVVQAMPRCDYLPSQPLKIPCGPAAVPGVPKLSPPCAGSSLLHVENLTPGARVYLDVGDTTYLGMIPPDVTAFTFQIAPLPAGAPIVVRQERCGLVSGLSGLSVGELSVSGGADLADPLLACARVVRVVGAQPGALLQIWAKGPTGDVPLSTQVFAVRDSVRVAVSPYLAEGQVVWVSQLACGGPWIDSVHHVVAKTPPVAAPEISVPPVAGDIAVTVDALPGARVDVYAESGDPPTAQLIGSGAIDPVVRTVGLDRPLSTADRVLADQSMCDKTSRLGHGTSVLPAERTFSLPSPLEWLSGVGERQPLVCDAASVTCRHDGTWRFTAHLENRETEADCSFIVAFEVPDPDGFGASLEGELSAAGEGRVTKIGIRVRGVPPADTFTSTGVFGLFRDPRYWSRLLGATGNFRIAIAGFTTYPELEADDAEEVPTD